MHPGFGRHLYISGILFGFPIATDFENSSFPTLEDKVSNIKVLGIVYFHPMKKIIIAAMALGLVFSPSANAATKVTLNPQFKVSHKSSYITLKFANLPKDHGIYVQQCMKPKLNQAPSNCNPAETSKLWVSSVPADIQQGAKDGTKAVKLHVDAYFKKGDCIHTTCVLAFTNDHMASSDRSEDQVIPFKFS